MGGASKSKKIRDRVDSEGKYGKWKLRIMASCHSSIRRGHWEFLLFSDWFSGFFAKKFGFSVLLFILFGRFYAIEHLVFGFRQKYKRFFGIFFGFSSI